MKKAKQAKHTSTKMSAKLNMNRKLFLVDIENLCGTNVVYSEFVLKAREYLAETLGLQDCDMVVIGTSSRQNMLAAKLAWMRASVENVDGKDGAEKALARALAGFDRRLDTFSKVIIASGDHYFTSIAKTLKDRGMDVIVVSQARCVSKSLAQEASMVQFAPDLAAGLVA